MTTERAVLAVRNVGIDDVDVGHVQLEGNVVFGQRAIEDQAPSARCKRNIGKADVFR